jgi:hypothetical protein
VSASVTLPTNSKVVSRVPGAPFQRFGEPWVRVAWDGTRVLAAGPGGEYIPSIAVVPCCTPSDGPFHNAPTQ